LQTNFLDKAVTRTLNILYRSGRLKDMPDIVREMMDEFDITYTGPMPRAQKRDDVLATRGWLQDTSALMQIQMGAEREPDVLDIPDFDKIERDLGMQAGVPAKYMKSQDEVTETRKVRAQQQAEQMKMAQMQQAGDAMKAVGEGTGAVNDNAGAAEALASVS